MSATTPDDRDERELEVIRGQMDQTRAALSEKLGALESQVMDTVATATEGVNTAVEGVKATVETVSETVTTVTESLNISKHVENSPFGAVGTAAAIGFVAAYMFGSDHAPAQAASPAEPQPHAPPPPAPAPAQQAFIPQPAPQAYTPQPAPAATSGACPTESHGDGIWGQALSGLTGLGVGAFTGLLRNLIATNLPPEMHRDLHNFVENITTGLGLPASANPVPAPTVDPPHPEEQAEERHPDDPKAKASGAKPAAKASNGGRPLAGKRM